MSFFSYHKHDVLECHGGIPAYARNRHDVPHRDRSGSFFHMHNASDRLQPLALGHKHSKRPLRSKPDIWTSSWKALKSRELVNKSAVKYLQKNVPFCVGQGKIHFCSRLFCCILTGVFCLGDFRRLTHFDAHQRRLYFGCGLPSQTYASINSPLARRCTIKKKTELFTFISNVQKKDRSFGVHFL